MIKVTENAKLKALELMNEDNAKNSRVGNRCAKQWRER